MAKIPPQLMKGQAILRLMQAGYTKAQARAMVEGGAKPGRRSRGDGEGREARPFPGGTGLTVPGPRGRLHVSVAAAPEVVLDNRALAQVWEGLIDALRMRGQVDPSELFPEQYPCENTDPAYADNRAMGKGMAEIIGVVLASLDVTPDEWASWYATKATVRLKPCPQPMYQSGGGYQLPADQGGGTAPPPALDTGWGTITGAPLLGPSR